MNLYTISDSDPEPNEIDGWWEAVWAHSEEDALNWGRENYSGGCLDDDPGIRVISVAEENGYLRPERFGVHRESRVSMLRLAGWRCEGEVACDRCGLYAMDMQAHRVDPETYLCPGCEDDR